MAVQIENILKEIEPYELAWDWHTHTTFSHGKGSIEDNVREAIRKGLSSIAISDHGPGHLTYGVKRENIPVMRAEVDRLQALYPEIKIYLSVEANIVEKPPYTDVTAEDLRYLDFLIAGYHYGITHGHCVGNWLDAHGAMPEVFGKRLLVKNTDMTLKCIYENDLRILTHPGDKGRFDIAAIAKACAERKVLMEINMKHPKLDVEGIRIAAREDVQFIISSDAHVVQNVGIYEGGLSRALEAGLDPARIVNIRRKDTEREEVRG